MMGTPWKYCVQPPEILEFRKCAWRVPFVKLSSQEILSKEILYLREEKLLIVENICFFPALCASLFDLLTFFGLGKAWL